MSQKITIDDEEREIDSLSERAQKQVINLRFTDKEIARTEALLAVLKTARATYMQALKEELEKPASTGELQ